MVGMKRWDVPGAWIGQRVRAGIETRRGGEYPVFAELADANDGGNQLFGGEALATGAGRPESTRVSPWASLVDVQPSKTG